MLRQNGHAHTHITTIKSEFPRCEAQKKNCRCTAGLRTHPDKMMSWTIVTQVQAEVQAASIVTPSDSAKSIIATCRHNQCEDQGGWDGLIFTLGMQGTLRWWMLALLWARLRSLPQGVLVIYFVSAASWRPCNVVQPHQGLVPHSWRLYGEPSAQCNDVALGTTKVCSGGK